MITIDVPRAWLLNANQRPHWAERWSRTQALRQAAWAEACSEMTISQPPFHSKVRCIVDVSWPDRRRRDAHNLMPTAKACVDGIVDAGLLVDDSDQWLEGPDIRVTESLCDKGFACRLVFRFEAAS